MTPEVARLNPLETPYFAVSHSIKLSMNSCRTAAETRWLKVLIRDSIFSATCRMNLVNKTSACSCFNLYLEFQDYL